MRRLTVVLTALALFGMTLPAGASSDQVVTNNNDSGAGSLRAALNSGASPIVLHPRVGDIEIGDGLVWAGSNDLVIKGSGQTITDSDGSASGALLTITDGADTSISRVDFRGPGGFDLENKGGGNGIKVDVPAGSTGIVAFGLDRVSISDVGHHGVHIDDLTNASDASVKVDVNRVTVANVGIGGFDEDGIRVDERGVGDIVFNSTRSQFEAAGADGVELDEGGPGDVVAEVDRTGFEANGNYCSFRFDEAALSDAGIELLDDFEDLAIIIDPADEQAVRDLFTPNEEECLEFVTEDGEMEVAIDIDDAFDIDEADEGSIDSSVARSSLTGNEDEGLDYDETGPGDIVGSVVRIEAADNTDEAIKYTEDGPGNVVATNSRVVGEDQDVEFEEFGEGDLSSNLTRSTVADLSLVEEDGGSFDSTVARSTVDDVEGEEAGDGDLDARFTRSTLDAVELSQEDAGSGVATFQRTTYDEADSEFDGVTIS